MKRLSTPLVAAAALLALAGCTDAADDPASKPGKSPLEPYLGYPPLTTGFGPAGGMTAAFEPADLSDAEKSKMRKVEEQVAACMRAEGFEYRAVSPDKQPASEFDKAYSLPPAEFARKYGYGISTMMSDVNPDDTPTDPNEKIRNELSPKAQKAYDKALYGSSVMMDESGGSGSGAITEIEPGGNGGPDAEDLGCIGKASEKEYGKAAKPDKKGETFDSLFSDLDALRKRFDRESKIVAATRQWSDCMADAGLAGLSKLGDAQQRVMDKLMPPGDGPKGDKQGRSVTIGGDADPKLQAYERKIAVADYKCQDKFVTQVARQVADKLEREFLADHKAELERFKEGMGKQQGGGDGTYVRGVG